MIPPSGAKAMSETRGCESSEFNASSDAMLIEKQKIASGGEEYGEDV
jgi:hypothetical protein